MKQPYLAQAFRPRTEHGGEIRRGKRKLSRPIDPKRPMHVVLRSSKARGKLSLLNRSRELQALTNRIARKHQVQLRKYANAGNHIHVIAQAKRRRDFQNFLRDLSGKIAQLVTGAKRGNAFGKFWDALAYTRVAAWGKAYEILKDYLTMNELEAAGIYGYRAKHAATSYCPDALRV